MPGSNHLKFQTTKQCTQWLEWLIKNNRAQICCREKNRERLKRGIPQQIACYRKIETKANTYKHTSVASTLIGNNDVLQWATRVPDEPTLGKFRNWASKLGGIVSDRKPKKDLIGSRRAWISTKEAIRVLEIVGR